MNFEDSADIPVNALAEKWDLAPQKIVSMIGVAKRSTIVFNQLVERGYDADEIPLWIVRDDEAAFAMRQRSTKVDGDADDTPESLLEPPELRETQGLGEGDQKIDLALCDDLRRPPAIAGDTRRAPTSVDEFSDDDLRYLTSLKITPMQDESGRWMQVSERADGSILMKPVDPHAVLHRRDLEAGAEKMRDTAGIIQLTMETLQAHTSAIMKKVALNPSVYMGHTAVTTTIDPKTNLRARRVCMYE